MRQLFDLEEGSLFVYSYNRNEVYTLVSLHPIGVEPSDRCIVRRIAWRFEDNREKWHVVEAKDLRDENSNPYAEVFPVTVQYQLREDPHREVNRETEPVHAGE